jgi:hypothetical protein
VSQNDTPSIEFFMDAFGPTKVGTQSEQETLLAALVLATTTLMAAPTFRISGSPFDSQMVAAICESAITKTRGRLH